MSDTAYILLIAVLCTALGFSAGMIASDRHWRSVELAFERCDSKQELFNQWLQTAQQFSGRGGGKK